MSFADRDIFNHGMPPLADERGPGMSDQPLDLAAIKAHREAVFPMLAAQPSSVLYQIVVDEMGALIAEVERLRQKYERPTEDRPRYRYRWRM